MLSTVEEVRCEEFPIAVGYVLSHLLSVAAAPVLAHELPTRSLPVTAGVLTLFVLACRWHQRTAIRGILSPARSRAVSLRVDFASVLLLACSILATLGHHTRETGTLIALLAAAALCGCLIMLQQASEVWFSSSFVSRQDASRLLPGQAQD